MLQVGIMFRIEEKGLYEWLPLREPLPNQPQPPFGTYTSGQGLTLTVESKKSQTNHLISAADYVTRILSSNEIPYALMGGFSLMLRGSQRATFDVDLAVGCDMQQLIQALKSQDRILRPWGPVAGVMRIFVNTGGQIDPSLPQLYTAVDLILRGSLGAPDDPRTCSEIVEVETNTGEKKEYTVLNIASIVASKLGAFFARGEEKDFTDIVFLFNEFAQQVYSVRAQLSQEHRQSFVNACVQSGFSQNKVRAVKHVFGIA